MTYHHNIPRSNGGSDERINLALIDTNRHSGYHACVDTRRPEQVIRSLALSSIGTTLVLDSDTIRELFKVISIKDWTSLYAEPAIDNNAPHRKRHTQRRILNEIDIVHQAASAITNGGVHPPQTLQRKAHRAAIAITNGGVHPHDNLSFLKRCLRFFDTASPRQAIVSLLTERNHSNELAWVKPLREDIRIELLKILGDKDITTPKLDKIEYIELLHGHEKFLKGQL